MKKSNIALIGMPGCGKSTIGILLAKTMRKDFIDTDLLIQQKHGNLLQDIIDNEGLKQFLAYEEKVVVDIDVKNHVIATGGSVIHSNAGLNHLKRDSILIYLQLRFDEIDSRIKNISSRGIAMEKGGSLIELFNKRVPLYEKHGDIIINCSNKHMEDIISEIKDRVSADGDI
ncbi:UNVERIFIED_CONTAM: shikimate kinase [Acetivibrio alkalicellulosi]